MKNRQSEYIAGQAGTRWAETTLDTYNFSGNEAAYPILTDWADHPEGGLYLYGRNGLGKTHLAVALMRRLLAQHRQVVFSPCAELLASLRKAFDEKPNWMQREFMDSLSTVEVLILDDLGAHKVSEWVIGELFLILDRRERNALRTVITSNLDLSEVAVTFGDRIASRIGGLCRLVKIVGADQRLLRQRTPTASET